MSEWKSLSDEEIENIANEIMFRLGSYDVDMVEIGRAIEKALKEKNGC